MTEINNPIIDAKMLNNMRDSLAAARTYLPKAATVANAFKKGPLFGAASLVGVTAEALSAAAAGYKTPTSQEQAGSLSQTKSTGEAAQVAKAAVEIDKATDVTTGNGGGAAIVADTTGTKPRKSHEDSSFNNVEQSMVQKQQSSFGLGNVEIS